MGSRLAQCYWSALLIHILISLKFEIALNLCLDDIGVGKRISNALFMPPKCLISFSYVQRPPTYKRLVPAVAIATFFFFPRTYLVLCSIWCPWSASLRSSALFGGHTHIFFALWRDYEPNWIHFIFAIFVSVQFCSWVSTPPSGGNSAG